MKVKPILAIILVALICFSLPACHVNTEENSQEQHAIIVTTPKVMDVTLTQQYVCLIHSQRHTKLRAMQSGYLMPIAVKVAGHSSSAA